MKKIILLLILLSGFKVNAQITLYREDFGVPGEWYLLATDNDVDVEELATLLTNGANANWDATGIRPQYQDTFFYLSPADFPSAPEGCNLLFSNPVLSSLPDFYNENIAQVKQIIQPDGFFGAEGKVLYLEFPSRYNTSFDDSIESVVYTLAVDLGIPENPLFDSAQIIFRYINHSSFVGHGTIRTKFTNLPINALKRKLISSRRTIFKVRNKITGAYVDIPGGFDPGGINSDKTIYQWFASNGGACVLQFEMDTLYKAKNLKYLVNSTRLMNTGISEPGKVNTFDIFPNPGKDYFEISIPTQTKIENLRIYNTSGVLVKELLNVFPGEKIFPEIESSGLFIIQLKHENKIYHSKWLKL